MAKGQWETDPEQDREIAVDERLAKARTLLAECNATLDQVMDWDTPQTSPGLEPVQREGIRGLTRVIESEAGRLAGRLRELESYLGKV